MLYTKNKALTHLKSRPCSWSHLGSNQGPPDYESVSFWSNLISYGLKCPFYGVFNYL